MKCKISKAQLIGYLYREMLAGEIAALEAHINTCEDCREELTSLQSASQVLGSWQEEDGNLNLTFVNETEMPESNFARFSGKQGFIKMAGLFAASILLGFVLMTLARHFWLETPDQNFAKNNTRAEEPQERENRANQSETPVTRNDSASQLTFENKFTTPGQAEALKKQLAITENVSLMENLLNKEFLQKNRQRFAKSGKTKGIYLTGKGMVFLVNTEQEKEFPGKEAARILERVNKRKNVEFFDSSHNHSTENLHSSHVNEFKSAVLNIVHTNENTFQLLSPDESIVIAVDPEMQKEARNGFIIELHKKDIDTFKHGKINMQELLKKVRVSDYK